VEENKFPNGINMVYNKEALKEIGCFSTKIVYKGINDRGEETELFYRYKKKYNTNCTYYCSNLIVYHYTRPKTMKLSHWVKSYWGTGKNHAKFVKREGKLKNIKDLFWILKKVFIELFMYLFKKRK